MTNGGKESLNDDKKLITNVVLIILVIFIGGPLLITMGLSVAVMDEDDRTEDFLPEADYKFDKDVVVKYVKDYTTGNWNFIIFSGSDVPKIISLTAYSADMQQTWEAKSQTGMKYVTRMPADGGTVYFVATFDDGGKMILADTSAGK